MTNRIVLNSRGSSQPSNQPKPGRVPPLRQTLRGEDGVRAPAGPRQQDRQRPHSGTAVA